MPGYALHCTVCKDDFETRSEWLTHLLQKKHLDLARRDVKRWDEEIKKKVVVAFSSVPVGCLEFLEHFSKGSLIPCDFLFWEEKPKLGFVFFESRNRVTEMLALGLDVRISGHIVHLKRATDYLQTELDHLMPHNCRHKKPLITVEALRKRIEESLKKVLQEATKKSRNENACRSSSQVQVSSNPEVHTDSNAMDIDSDHAHQQDEDTDSESSSSSDSESSTLPMLDKDNECVHKLVEDYVTIRQVVEIEDQERSQAKVFVKPEYYTDSDTNSMDIDSNHSHQQDERIDSESSSSSHSEFSSLAIPDKDNDPVHQLVKDYFTIREAVEIPDELEMAALDVIQRIEKIFVQYLHLPVCKLYMFRHKYTKIRHFKHDEFLIFVDCEGTLTNGCMTPDCKTREIFDVHKMRSCFKSRIGQRLLPRVVIISHDKQENLYKRGGERSGQLLKLITHESLWPLRLVTDIRFLVETQTCRLLKYLLKFDSRASPLLTLVSYWAHNVEIPFFKLKKLNPEELNESWRLTPQPGAVEWLVMLFLCHKKMIPTPREVQGRPHNVLMVFEGPDIGFSDNEDFVQEWKSKTASQLPKENTVEFVLDLIRLVKELFEFYGELEFGKWILNPKDGEVINKFAIFNKSLSKAATKLELHEMYRIKRIRFENTSIDIGRWKVMFLNPLHVAHCFAFDDKTFVTKVCPVMKKMASVFSKYLQCHMDSKISLISLFSYNCKEYLQFAHDDTTNNDSTETQDVNADIWETRNNNQTRPDTSTLPKKKKKKSKRRNQKSSSTHLAKSKKIYAEFLLSLSHPAP